MFRRPESTKTAYAVVWTGFHIMLFTTAVLAACSPAAQTGPVEVRWDSDTCSRCAMALSDRNFAAQVRGGESGGKTRAYVFDDLGCAVLWLEQQDWKDDPRTEIWVKDHRSSHWIDARTARYVSGMHTPMGFGLGALATADGSVSAETLGFEQAVAHIHHIEATEHRHKGMHGADHSHHGGGA